MTDTRDKADIPRGEKTAGVIWLSVGALISLLLEAVNLDTRIGGIVVPLSVVIAALFNSVLTKTAALWSDLVLVKLVPLAVWVAGFFVLLSVFPARGAMVLPESPLTLLLLFAGLGGGVWPLFGRK